MCAQTDSWNSEMQTGLKYKHGNRAPSTGSAQALALMSATRARARCVCIFEHWHAVATHVLVAAGALLPGCAYRQAEELRHATALALQRHRSIHKSAMSEQSEHLVQGTELRLQPLCSLLCATALTRALAGADVESGHAARPPTENR